MVGVMLFTPIEIGSRWRNSLQYGRGQPVQLYAL